MIHMWIEPHPCGPFAALEGIGGGQIAEGEAWRSCAAPGPTKASSTCSSAPATLVALITSKVVTAPSPLLNLAVRGWIASVEEATFLWLRDRPCSRETLIDLLFRSAMQLLPLVDETVLGPS